MKKWLVTHTRDKEHFKTTEIEEITYTRAYLNFSVKYPEEIIYELKEVSNG